MVWKVISIFLFSFFFFITSIIEGSVTNKIILTSSSSNDLYVGGVRIINVAVIKISNSITTLNTNISAVIRVKGNSDNILIKPSYWSSSTSPAEKEVDLELVKGRGSIYVSSYYTGNYKLRFYDRRNISEDEKFISASNNINFVSPDSSYAGKVFINEIMSEVSLLNEKKWLEIYNNSGNSIDLSTFYFLRITSSFKVFIKQLSASSVSLLDKSFAVTTPSLAVFKRTFPFITYGTGEYKDSKFVEFVKNTTLSLSSKFGDVSSSGGSDTTYISSGTGVIFLVDASGNLVDFVAYDSSWGGDKDISLERKSIERDSMDEYNWGSSVDYRGGTPGKANSISVSSAPSEFDKSNISISRNPFDPRSNNGDSSTEIKFKMDRNGSLEIDLYDINGRYLFNIKKESLVSKDTLINYLFNGKKPDGSYLLPGMYVLYFKIVDSDTGEVIKHSKILVVGTELK